MMGEIPEEGSRFDVPKFGLANNKIIIYNVITYTINHLLSFIAHVVFTI
jgi:hypothetical protein